MNNLNLNFHMPVKVISGPGCFKSFDRFREFGQKAFIVCGQNSARVCGALDHAKISLAGCKVEYRIFDRVEQNPTVETCAQAAKQAREFGASFILAIGGGSPLDAAKAVAVYAANPAMPALDIFENGFTKPPLPILAVAITAGTGSEVTPYSVLTVHSLGTKKSFASPLVYPKIAFLDPVYTYSLPLDFTASTAVDALSHAVEGFFCVNINIATRGMALGAMGTLAECIRDLANGNLDNSVRAKLLYAASVAGMVIAHTGTGAVHPMGYPLTYYKGVPHGHANAYFLADFLKLMGQEKPQQLKTALNAMRLTSPEELHSLISRVMVFDQKLSYDEAITYSIEAAKAKNCANTDPAVTESQILDIYKKLV